MRVVPVIGMAVRIVHLGAEEPAVVEEVREAGRVVVAGGITFALHPTTGRFVREGDPYYGKRLILNP